MSAMNTLSGQPGELRATITITRKATGKQETYELIGTPVAETQPQQQKEQDNGCNPLDRGA